MNIIIIILCVIFAVVYGHNDVDNYARVNYDQYERILNGYDAKLAHFAKHYRGRIESVSFTKEMIVNSIVEVEERISPLLLLRDTTKDCILTYHERIASVDATKEAIAQCELNATTQLKTLLAASLDIRNALEYYMRNNYSQRVIMCADDFVNLSKNYTSCVTAAASTANKYVFENQKSFEYELEAAECLAKANVKHAIDCSYSFEIDVLSKLGEFEALTGKCFVREAECIPCEEYTCAEAANLRVNYNNATIHNPLYGRSDSPQCLILNLE